VCVSVEANKVPAPQYNKERRDNFNAFFFAEEER
jgi:hypothetical protein